MLNDPLYIGSLNWPSVKKSNWGRPIVHRWDQAAGCKQNHSTVASSLKATDNVTSHPLGGFCHRPSCQPNLWAGRSQEKEELPCPAWLLCPAWLHIICKARRANWVQHGNGLTDSHSFLKPFWPLQLGTAWMHRLQRHWDQKANIKTLNILDDILYFKSISWLHWDGGKHGSVQSGIWSSRNWQSGTGMYPASRAADKAAVPSASDRQIPWLHHGRLFPALLCPVLQVQSPILAPPKTSHNLWWQTHEDIGWHFRNASFAPASGTSCLLVVLCNNLSVLLAPSYAVIES